MRTTMGVAALAAGACLALAGEAGAVEVADASASAPAQDAAVPVEGDWALFATAGGGARVAGGTPGGGLAANAGLRYRVGSWVAVEAAVGEGVYDEPGELVGRIALGARLGAAGDGLRPSLLLGVVHDHEETLENAKDAPLATAAAVTDTIRHRTGLEAGVGVSLPPPLVLFGFGPRPLLAARAGRYFDDAKTPLYVTLELGAELPL